MANFLDANEWNYTPVEDKNYFVTNCRIKDTGVRVVIDVYETEGWQRVLVYAIYPVYAPEKRRAAALESIARINYSMAVGTFEMDCKDGEIRVRSAAESDGQLGDAMIDRAMRSSIDAADRYFAPLAAVAFGNAAPESALELVTKTEDTTLQ